MNRIKKISIQETIKFLGSPKIFVFAIAWMIVLVIIGTYDQKTIGLYQAQQKYFFSWGTTIFGFIPIPSGLLLMSIISLNLSFYFTRPNIFKLSKEFPIQYGVISIVFAIVLGVSAAFVRRFLSDLRKKYFKKLA